MNRFGIAPLVLAALLLAGCGGGPEEGAQGDGTAAPPENLTAKPEVTVPPGQSPPDDLVVEDLAEGEGPEATAGSTVTVHYVGVSWSSGEQFDASWDRGQPFTFELGAGDVIAGWERGVDGMRVGGRRHLTIPPDLAYGEAGAGTAIGPGETLVFVVDLLAVDGVGAGGQAPSPNA